MRRRPRAPFLVHGLNYNPHPMKLTLDEVRHVANLARLGLSDDELQAMASQLSTILEYIDKLEQIDTGAIPPTAQVGELADVMREDEVSPSLPQEAALANAPARDDGYFRVAAIQE
jgi:aspartyl-tRNA(Asn)/glutamyl-tRNA(Gln) amidotransferase subunit C